MDATDLPSLSHLRSATTLEGAPPFHVSIVVGPGFVPMDIVGVQTVLGLVPGAKIHLLWKTDELSAPSHCLHRHAGSSAVARSYVPTASSRDAVDLPTL